MSRPKYGSGREAQWEMEDDDTGRSGRVQLTERLSVFRGIWNLPFFSIVLGLMILREDHGQLYVLEKSASKGDPHRGTRRVERTMKTPATDSLNRIW